MQTLALAITGRQTTRLGFGCSSVLGVLGRADSLSMLEAAFDAGIRHFDVAPSYGHGAAEACVGEFLARHPGQCTVTTKFGIPAEARSWKSSVRALARPVLKALPGLKAKLQGTMAATAAASSGPSNHDYSAAAARASLDRSLAALRVERIDLWLLHEATFQDLVDADDLLRFMQDAQTAGKIGSFGIGSTRANVPALLSTCAAYCPVLQYEWSVLDPLEMPDEHFRIHHRALTDNFRSLHQALTDDAARCRRWSDLVGQNLAEAETLAGLMLQASLAANPRALVLFSSKHAGHIRRNAALVGDEASEQAALRLYALVRAEVAA